jgi:hypothetical protein
MERFLKFLLGVTVAIWLGMAVFFTFAAGPAFFSEPMLEIFKKAGASEPKQFSGLVAMMMLAKYYHWNYVCGALALLLLLAEKWILGHPVRKVGLIAAVLALGLAAVAAQGIQPRLHGLYQVKYDVQRPESERVTAGKQFGALHGISQMLNLTAIASLLVLAWSVTKRSPDVTSRNT